MEQSEENFFVLHVDSRSVLWQNTLSYLARKDAQHLKCHLEESTNTHQSEIIAKSNNFTIDEPHENLRLDNEQLRYYINFTLENGTNHSGVTVKTRSCSLLEYRDDGANFYRDHFLPLGDRHQNWFGVRPNGEAVAVSLARVLLSNGQKQRAGSSSVRRPVRLFQSERPLSDQSGFIQTISPLPGRRPLKAVHTDEVSGSSNLNGFGLTHPVKQQNGLQPRTDLEGDLVPAWLVIVRTEKDFDLRCCVVDQTPEATRLQHSSSVKSDTILTSVQPATSAESKKAGRKGGGLMRNSGKKDQFAKTLVTMDPRTQAMLRSITQGQINPSELQLGKAEPSIYEKLAKMDELQLLDQHKFGVLLCKADQTTEKEMYNNEHSTPAFDQFLDLLGSRVSLKNFTGYAAGLDTKTNATGVETCVSEFHGFPITFLVSTMLPFHSKATEQVARKRHVGNSSVTFIFQEQGALPLEADTIVSRFQQVLIVVRQIQSTSVIPHYRIAVCRANGVPPFGPVIDENHTYKHGRELADLLLEKACNGANAALRAEKFRSMILRSRSEYLHQFANEHVWLSPITQIRDQKNSPFRSIGRKRSSTLATTQLFSDPDIQLTLTSDNPDVTNTESDGQSNSQSTLRNSSVELRGTHSKHRSKDKKSHASAKSIHASNSLDTSASLSTVRMPSLVQLSCLDLGHTFHVLLQDVHSLYGHLSPSRLCNPDADKSCSKLEPLVALTLSKHWLIITTAVIQTGPDVRLILAIPTNSIFAYSFESTENIIVLYVNYGQSIRIKCPAPLRTSKTGFNVCHQIRQFLLEALPTGLLREVRELKIQCSNVQEFLSENDKEGEPTYRTDDRDELLHQRRKAHVGRRFALSDLGVHISFTRVQTDGEPETTLMPYLFKIDEDSPAQRAGLRRGQIILRIGTHEIADLFRASLCIPADSQSDELIHDPFTLRCASVRFETVDVLSLIRRLRFSQDILFAVGSVFDAETSLSPARANSLINQISFPYLRSPPAKRSPIPSRSKDLNVSIVDEQSKINGWITENEGKVHIPRRLSTSGSCTKATEMSAPIWIEQSKLPRSPLLHQRPVMVDQLQLVNRTVTRLNSVPGESDKCKPPESSSCADPDRSPGNPRSVRWSCASLFDSEGELRKAAAASDDRRNTLTRASNTKYKDERNVDSIEVDEVMRNWDALYNARNWTRPDKEKTGYATVQIKQPRRYPTQGHQASRISSFFDQLGIQSAKWRSNPQLNTLTDSVYSQLQSGSPDTGRLNHDPEALTIKSQVTSSPKANLRSNRSIPSEQAFDSNRTISINTITFDRRSRLDGGDSKHALWFPMQQSQLRADKTRSVQEEDRPQVPPRSASRVQEKYVIVGGKQPVGSPSVTHRNSLTTDSEDKARGAKYIYITPETERKTSQKVQTENIRGPLFISDQTEDNKSLGDPLNLHFRVQELEKQLRLEQKRRSQMATMCASLMEENRQLRSNRMPDYSARQSTIYSQPQDTGRGRTTVDPTKSRAPISTSQTAMRSKINFLPKFESETDI